MMRVKVVVSGGLELNSYVADALVYQQVVEIINGVMVQVPGIVVKLDSGEIKVQPLQMDKHVVEVFEVNNEDSYKCPDALIALPLYKSHKVVGAFKIAEIINGSLNSWNGAIKVNVRDEYFSKHKPQVGGYYVKYEDGYESYSPAQAFESGYTRIS